jgi:hypothetical protein
MEFGEMSMNMSEGGGELEGGGAVAIEMTRDNHPDKETF